MNENKGRKGGLGFDPSNVGAQADAYNVAWTALKLDSKRGPDIRRAFPQGEGPYTSARLAVALHVISGLLHRQAERLCNEDLTCPKCAGQGEYAPGQSGAPMQACPRCAGRGNTLGRREASLLADAQEIAGHYGLRAYHQTDPRGCALYLLDPGTDDNDYNRGHAVCRLGR
jgi:hypothetical protein